MALDPLKLEPQCGCSTRNPGPPQEQPVLLHAEPSVRQLSLKSGASFSSQTAETRIKTNPDAVSTAAAGPCPYTAIVCRPRPCALAVVSCQVTRRVITSVFVYPVEEKIHCAYFSYLVVLAVQPEDLLTAVLHCFALRQKGRSVIAGEEKKICC